MSEGDFAAEEVGCGRYESAAPATLVQGYRVLLEENGNLVKLIL